MRSCSYAVSAQSFQPRSVDPEPCEFSGTWCSVGSCPISPIGTERREGGMAGALATAAMDTLLYVRYRRSGGSEGPFRWEFSANVHGWEDTVAPGLVGKRLVEKILGHQAPDKWARPIQNAMHWGTGMD